MKEITDFRPSPIAGTWYSANPQKLRSQTLEFLAQAELPDLSGEVVALIAPHAGHKYSGQTAAYAFRTVQGQHFDVVVVLSPLHTFHPAPLLTTAHDAYSTPLGQIQVDRETLSNLDSTLEQSAGLGLVAVRNDSEHSLEIQLPFLQCALENEFLLVPIMLRSLSETVLEALGKALGKVLNGKKALMVASTDLSHFYPESVAKELDSEMLSQIRSFSPESVLQTERTGKGYACGVGAVASILWASRELGADRVVILHHSTSGQSTGDFDSVVGYGAAAAIRSNDAH
jgi:MEMO1 family protein